MKKITIKQSSKTFLASILSITGAFCLPTVQSYALNVGVVAGASTSTIQSAIDQVTAAGGGNVNLAAGSYMITTPILMKSYVTLNGAGNPATTMSIMGNFTGIQHATEGLTNVTIQNLKLIGTGETVSSSCNGIIISSLNAYHTTLKISNVQVLSCGGMGMHNKRVNGITVTNCNFHDNAGFTLMHNYYIRESTSGNVTGTIMSNGGSGFHIAGVCSGMVADGCQASGNASIGMHIQDTPSNVTVKNCTVSNNVQDGINLTGTSALINNNTCNTNGGDGIITWLGSGTVSNNHASGNATGNYEFHGTWTSSNNL